MFAKMMKKLCLHRGYEQQFQVPMSGSGILRDTPGKGKHTILRASRLPPCILRPASNAGKCTRIGRTWGSQRAHKYQDPTNNGFWYPPHKHTRWYGVYGIWYRIYGIWYIKIRILQTMIFLVAPFYWALEPECEILMFMWSFGALRTTAGHWPFHGFRLQSKFARG